jgi:hypothetical protein
VTFKEIFENEVAVNCAGTGAVAGIGVGPSGEPGVPKKKKDVLLYGGKVARRNAGADER